MSRRSGQSGSLVKQSGWWRVRFRLDQPGVEARKHKSIKVAPIKTRLSRPELERRAAELVRDAGANDEDRFNKTVLGEVTFREQAKIYVQEATSRNRRPIRNPVSIEGALRKWINPSIGDLPLALVDNLTVKPLVNKMIAGKLKPRTVNKYVELVKQVVKSLKAPNGEPVHKRVWDAATMDLPIVRHKEQKRPALKVEGVNGLISNASPGQEQTLYVLVAAAGLRVSEALALEPRHFINGGRTIRIEQQVKKDRASIVMYLKTDAAHREIDLCSAVAEYLRPYVGRKTKLLFHTKHGTPHLYGNLERRWLTPRLKKMGLDEKGMGWHSLRRFRNTWLRLQRAQPDLLNFWMGHKPESMTEVYSHVADDLRIRLASRSASGTALSCQNPKLFLNVPRKAKRKRQ